MIDASPPHFRTGAHPILYCPRCARPARFVPGDAGLALRIAVESQLAAAGTVLGCHSCMATFHVQQLPYEPLRCSEGSPPVDHDDSDDDQPDPAPPPPPHRPRPSRPALTDEGPYDAATEE